jgi:alpha-tubulin suppressor-like RCC1 family protein
MRASVIILFPAVIAVLTAGCSEEPPLTAPTSPAAAAIATTLDFAQISTGRNHACGTTAAGEAWCWGSNAQGQLGVPLAQSRHCDAARPCSVRPLAVGGGLRFRHVVAGWEFTCGVTTGDRIYCWGKNDQGQLGTGSTATFNPAPSSVAGNRRYRQVRAWAGAACAITMSRAAFCWGDNSAGQLGNGTDRSSRVPTRIGGPPGLLWRQLTMGGAHTCGITTGNGAWCWGTNASGQLGDGTKIRRFIPGAVSGALAVAQIEAGLFHTCAATTAGRAYCWGDGIAIGNGAGLDPVATPTPVAGRRTWDNVSGGSGFTCAVTATARGLCWGSGASGALGNGTSLNQLRPVPVAGSLSFVAINAGSEFACGVGTNGQGWCWGGNSNGQLGDGSLVSKMTPSPVLGPES